MLQKISKHRMLLFIRFVKAQTGIHSEISKHRMLLFICHVSQLNGPVFHFKTSYVTVYLDCFQQFLHFLVQFQNIVCYCLSTYLQKNCPGWEFQNIVCYCLSSHLGCTLSALVISKHRMLLFIHKGNCFIGNERKFQNIVCYCLSVSDNKECQGFILISKHRMLLFIIFIIIFYICIF